MATLKEMKDFSADKPVPPYTMTIARINCGSLMRIADAAELMAKNHAELVRDADLHKKLYESAIQQLRHKDYQIASLRGVITRLRRQGERKCK